MNDVSEQQLYGVVRLFAAYVKTKYEQEKKELMAIKTYVQPIVLF